MRRTAVFKKVYRFVKTLTQTLLRLPARFLIAMIRLYRLFGSLWLGNQCRFHPTCSSYALEALEQHGALKGSWLAARRLSRCHPFCEGGFDPVPETTEKNHVKHSHVTPHEPGCAP
jgi:putative membrane protein insertion efficiency factor